MEESLADLLEAEAHALVNVATLLEIAAKPGNTSARTAAKRAPEILTDSSKRLMRLAESCRTASA